MLQYIDFGYPLSLKDTEKEKVFGALLGLLISLIMNNITVHPFDLIWYDPFKEMYKRVAELQPISNKQSVF